MPRHDQQAGVFVVPVDADGRLFPTYRVEFATYLGAGKYQTSTALMDLQPSGLLKAMISGRTINFQLRHEGAKPVVNQYVGQLSHPDFALPLAEIEPEAGEQLQELYAREHIVIIGCDPLTKNSGADALPQTA